MDPYLGPVAGASLAAFAAGLLLGVVRLRRKFRAHSARKGMKAASTDAATPTPAVDAPDTASVDADTAPPVFGALALVAIASGLAVVVAARAAGDAPPPVAAAPGPSLAVLAARLSTIALVGAFACVLALGASFLVALLERGIARVLARFVPATRAVPEETPLDVGALLASGRTRGEAEPFGVGLATLVLVGAPVFATGCLVVAAGGGPAPAAAVAVALLLVPVAYAAAAERTPHPAAARLRRDAAVRQLAAAPVWGAALAAFPSPVALALFPLAAAFALPGTHERPGVFALPWGGDRAEANPAVRALSRVAHGAWIAVVAALPVVALAGPARGPGETAVLVGRALVALVALVAARAIVRRFVAPGPAPVAAEAA